MKTANTETENISGRIVSVRGSAVDMEFPEKLPPIYSLIHAGAKDSLLIEATVHLDEQFPRGGIALNATAGLFRGDHAWTDGRPLKAPLGKGLLGRMFNVFG